MSPYNYQTVFMSPYYYQTVFMSNYIYYTFVCLLLTLLVSFYVSLSTLNLSCASLSVIDLLYVSLSGNALFCLLISNRPFLCLIIITIRPLSCLLVTIRPSYVSLSLLRSYFKGSFYSSLRLHSIVHPITKWHYNDWLRLLSHIQRCMICPSFNTLHHRLHHSSQNLFLGSAREKQRCWGPCGGASAKSSSPTLLRP